MKKICFLSLFASLSICLTSNGFAKEPLPSIIETMVRRPNHIYIGPDFASLRVDAKIRDFRVEGHKSLSGLGLGYERLKPRSFYAVFEIFVTNTHQKLSASIKDADYELDGQLRLGIMQTRFGYAFLKKKVLITPYLGLGIRQVSNRVHDGYEESFAFLSAGVKTQLQLASVCLIGFDGEIFGTPSIRQEMRIGNKKTVDHSSGLGYALGLPFTLRLGANWDMKITPSLTRLFSSRAMDIYATSVLLGYRF